MPLLGLWEMVLLELMRVKRSTVAKKTMFQSTLMKNTRNLARLLLTINLVWSSLSGPRNMTYKLLTCIL